jgi:plasmid stabilization system protein ParE
LAEVAFRKAAESDLAIIVRYSLAEFGRDVAVSYLDAFDELWLLLAEHPRAGAVYGRRGRQVIRAQSCGSHRVFYIVRGKRVWVLRMLHGSRDHDRIMRMGRASR